MHNLPDTEGDAKRLSQSTMDFSLTPLCHLLHARVCPPYADHLNLSRPMPIIKLLIHIAPVHFPAAFSLASIRATQSPDLLSLDRHFICLAAITSLHSTDYAPSGSLTLFLLYPRRSTPHDFYCLFFMQP